MKSPNRQQKMRHPILPHEALITIDLIHTIEPETTMNHVAFVFGISVKTLEKAHRELLLMQDGDDDACRKYNSRSQFMRLVKAYHSLLEHDRDTVVALIRDAKQNASNCKNVLGASVKDSMLSGLTDAETTTTHFAYKDYMES
jgi:hypothetical protein